MPLMLVVALLLQNGPAELKSLNRPAVAPDSVILGRLRSRIEGQQMIRVQVGDDRYELTRPQLLDSAIAFREAWSDRTGDRDTSVANPLPLARASAVEVRGKRVLPSVIGAGLSVGVSVFASMWLTKLVDSNSGIESGEIWRVSLMGLGAGAALGALDGLGRTRWVTVWRRTDADGTDGEGSHEEAGPQGR